MTNPQKCKIFRERFSYRLEDVINNWIKQGNRPRNGNDPGVCRFIFNISYQVVDSMHVALVIYNDEEVW